MDPLACGGAGRVVEGVPTVEHPLSPPLSLTRSSRKQSRTIPDPRAGVPRSDDATSSPAGPSSYFSIGNQAAETPSAVLVGQDVRLSPPTSLSCEEDELASDGPGQSWDGSVRGLAKPNRRHGAASLTVPKSSSTARSASSSSTSSSSRGLVGSASSRTTPPRQPLPTPLQVPAGSSPSSSKSSPSVLQLPKTATTPTQSSHRQLANAEASSSSMTTPNSSASPPRSRRSRKAPLVLSREEERALAARYDLLTAEEFATALAPWDSEGDTGELFGRSRRRRSPTDKDKPVEDDQPLFPPSPPGSPGRVREHPLRILARVGWMLWRHQLEDHDSDEPDGQEPSPPDRHPRDATLQSDLSEALSTSLETSSSAFLPSHTPPDDTLPTPSGSLHLSSTSSLALPAPRNGPAVNSPLHRRDKARQGSVSTLSSFVSNRSEASTVSSSHLDTAPTPATKSRAASLRNEITTGSLPMRNGASKKRSSKEDKKRDRAGGGSIGDWVAWGWGGGSSASSSVAQANGPKKSLRGFLSPPILSPAIATTQDKTMDPLGLPPTQTASNFPATPSSMPTGSSTLANGHAATPSSERQASPSHFRAVFLATRIISSNPTSLLSNPSAVSELVSGLAFSLVSNARDANITLKESSRARRASSEDRGRRAVLAPTAISVPATTTSQLSSSPAKSKSVGTSSREQPLAAASSVLSRVLNSATLSTSSTRSKPRQPSGLVVPASQLSPSTELGPKTPGSALGGGYPFPHSSSSIAATAAIPSVELEPIEPAASKPPTLIFDRAGYLKGVFGGQPIGEGSAREKRASRFEKSSDALTDRYGFIYDVTSIKMLRDASEAGAPAPATFSGNPNRHSDDSDTDEEEDWVERNIQFVQDSPTKPTSRLMGHAESEMGEPTSFDMRTSLSSASGVSVISTDTIGRLQPSEAANPSSSTPTDPRRGSSRHRSSTVVSLNPSPVRPVISPQTFHVSADSPSFDNDLLSSPGHGRTSNPMSLTGRKTIQILLNQLTDIHDSQQSARKTAWDAFLRRRRDALAVATTNGGGTGEDAGFVGFAQMGLGGKAGKEDHKDFVRLVREGIPISYRAKVWAECSGASDVMAPGEYDELLAMAEKEGVDSTVRNEIEKDVVRTLPLNIFFAADGPGVVKLRRILTAFAWHDMSVGYCQGLNMVAATLLLTHQREEEAFWVFLCVVERLMPPNYYSPDLLCSRADQRVLQDFVGQELPALNQHMANHGIEMTAVAFGWFLSLFTDCLPVETLFRTWDVFFVEGFDTFFRVAIAILKVNEAHLLSCDNTSTLYQHLGGCASRLWNADQLLAIEHELKQTITHDAITSRRAVHVSALVEEMGGDRPY